MNGLNGYWMTVILAALALACLVVIGMLLPSAAHAQQQQALLCGDRDKIVRMLTKQQEMPRALGVTDKDYLEIYTSPDGAWTILLTQPPGRVTCIMAAGHSWEITPQQIPGSPS